VPTIIEGGLLFLDSPHSTTDTIKQAPLSSGT